MTLISCDVGYGFTKVIAANNSRRTLYPSAVAPRRSSGELAAALGSTAPRHALDLHPDRGSPERYWIGQAALDAGASRAWETEASARAGYDVLVLAGAALTGAEGRIELAAGLPLAVWLRGKDERRALRERLEGLAGWVSVDGEPARRLEVARARVYPQALGAAVAALRGLEIGGDGTVCVVDVGYRTTDYLLLSIHGGLPTPDEERSGSIDLGIGRVYDAVRDAVAARTGGFPPPEAVIERAVSGSGAVRFRGTEIDVRRPWESACMELAAEIEYHVRRVWSDALDWADVVVLAGGGAAPLSTHLSLPSMTMVPDPQWANAVGFLALAQAAQAAGPTGPGR